MTTSLFSPQHRRKMLWYQNNRETADPYAIELARRGIVVLSIDAIGRGNSGEPADPDAPDFDPTYGGTASLAYLKGLPFVDETRVGMMGHSLGAEMAYTVALNDPSVQALSISGFAYGEEATPTQPKNMLMIFAHWDEYRVRMTGTNDFAGEWMSRHGHSASFLWPIHNSASPMATSPTAARGAFICRRRFTS